MGHYNRTAGPDCWTDRRILLHAESSEVNGGGLARYRFERHNWNSRDAGRSLRFLHQPVHVADDLRREVPLPAPRTDLGWYPFEDEVLTFPVPVNRNQLLAVGQLRIAVLAEIQFHFVIPLAHRQ